VAEQLPTQSRKLTWLETRPLLESKRLPELLISQARYLTYHRGAAYTNIWQIEKQQISLMP